MVHMMFVLQLLVSCFVLIHWTTGQSVQDTNKASLTTDDRTKFLNKHNALRAAVSPTASDMKEMEWNCDLESMAQEWANTCNFAHGQPARDPKPFTNIGQNLWAGSAGYNVEGSVQAWYNEVANYTLSKNACDSGAVCGHYTQVVWANSYALGCGIKYCASMFENKGGYYIVCNYGPAGNFVDQSPYTQGSSCGSCPAGFPICRSSQCGKSSGPAAIPSCPAVTITSSSTRKATSDTTMKFLVPAVIYVWKISRMTML